MNRDWLPVFCLACGWLIGSLIREAVTWATSGSGGRGGKG